MEFERGVSGGPWDESDSGVPLVESVGDRVVSFGGLRLRVPEGVEVQVQADQTTGHISQLTLRDGDSGMQLQPYASRKSSGMWAEVLESLKSSVNSAGGLVEEAEGKYGTELLAQVQAAGEPGGLQPVRFVGVDGPRWFLRAVFMGAAARDIGAGVRLGQIFESAVVFRGDTAMAPGAPIVLNLPQDTNTDKAAPVKPAGLNPFVRGPEITEIR
ncbi:MAG: DUF3710 domain-containing protein [Candidatus Nanopelagicales bacterium]|nr:DUF3710 domain-containing protein [Candidatus Nanopelagicales bacterium]